MAHLGFLTAHPGERQACSILAGMVPTTYWTFNGTVTFDTTVVRSPGRSFKCDTGAGATAASVTTGASLSGTATARGYWIRQAVRVESLPTSATSVTVLAWRSTANTILLQARLTSGGKFQLWNQSAGSQIGSDSTLTAATGAFYYVELYIKVATGGGAASEAQLRVTPDSTGTTETVASTTTANLGSTAPGHFAFGILAGAGAMTANLVGYFTDGSLNDDQGANRNGWVGPEKISQSVPLSDKTFLNWFDGAGGVTTLYPGVNNVPPAGVAAASENATSQIKSTSTSGTASYEANMQSYAKLMAASEIITSDTYNVAQVIGWASGVNLVAQSFTADGNPVRYVKVLLGKNGSPTDNVVVELRADSSGSPAATALASASASAAAIAGSNTPVIVELDSAITTVNGTLYWIVLSRSGAGDSTNYPIWGGDNTVPYAGGSAKTQNVGSSTWVAVTGWDQCMTIFTGLGGTVNVVQAMAITGQEVTTGSRTGTLQITANPAEGSATSIDFNETGGSGGACGTYPTGWDWEKGAINYSPTITALGIPTLKIVKTDTGNRYDDVCFMALYVAWVSTVPSGAQITRTNTSSIGITPTLSRVVTNTRTPTIAPSHSATLSRQATNTRTQTATDANSAALSRVGVHPRTPAITDAHTAALARQALNTRTPTISVAHAAALSRAWSGTRGAAVSVAISPTLSRVFVPTRTLTITDSNAAAISRRVIFTRSDVISVASTATLARQVTNTRTLTISDAHSAVVTRAFVYARTQVISAANSAVLSRAVNLIRTVTISVTATPTLSRILIAIRAPTISRAITATLSRAQVLTRASAWSAGATATLSRVYVAVRTATISRTNVAALSRAVTNTRTATISVVQTAVLSRAQLLSRLSAISVAPTAALSRLQSLIRTATISRAHTATLSRTVVPGGGNILTRTMTVSISHVAALSRAVTNTRNPVWSAAHIAMLTRVANVVRTAATTVANTAALSRVHVAPRTLAWTGSVVATLSRAEVVARTLAINLSNTETLGRNLVAARLATVSTAHTAVLTRAAAVARLSTWTISHAASLSKSVIWARGGAWTADHAAALARQTTAIRGAATEVAHSVTVSRAVSLIRTVATSITHSAVLAGFRFEPLPPGTIGRLIGRATSIGRLVMRVSPIGKLIQSTRLRGRRR